jgi:hypothetical protein
MSSFAFQFGLILAITCLSINDFGDHFMTALWYDANGQNNK